MPKFSIIMPSRLIPYKGCAQFLDQKLLRSVKSVLEQSYKGFELIIISDDCLKTIELVTTNFTDKRLILIECSHKTLFDNLPRNAGINLADGEFIIYCDIDDYWGPDHLKTVMENLNGYDWVWYNDFIFNGQWQERACNIKSLGGCGTSNICHKRSLGIKWERPGYAHDFYFVQKLLNFKNYTKIETPEYFVCHIPGNYDL
jgi:glycosyltransferase involved in cell wall biosynthesis